MEKRHRPPIASLACANHECPSYGRAGQGNLIEGRIRWIRKVYGPDQIRYTKDGFAGYAAGVVQESSANVRTPHKDGQERLRWTRRVRFCFGCGTARSERAKPSLLLIQRIRPCSSPRAARRSSESALAVPRPAVQQLASTSLQAAERWGFAGSKREQLWQAEVIDPATKLVVAFATGVRDERLIGSSESVLQVLQDAVSRLSYPQGVVLFSDGEPSYKRL